MKRTMMILAVLFQTFAVMAQQPIPYAYTYDVSGLSKKDFKKCMKAAKKGDAVQQFVLATCYKDGQWVAPDNMMALDWYTKSADQGNDYAASVLAYVYETGSIADKNLTKAVSYYTQLAKHCYSRAQKFLGDWYYSQQDYASAIPWLTQTAGQGNVDDQYRLGYLYFEGKGVAKNYTEAAKWFGKAAEQGDANAQNYLGWCYENGKGITQSYTEAVRLYRESADKGNVLSQYQLGMCYMEGKGVSQNYGEAKKWLSKAAGHGNVDAKTALAEIEELLSKRTFIVNGVSFDMVRVEGGTFTMGATTEQEDDAESDEFPAHDVTLSSYFIGKTEVTQELWEAVMGSNPSYFKGGKRPVEQVSWNDCQTFIRKLNALTGQRFRLPTEAEWEYAARGGGKSKGYKYSGSNIVDDVAWYYGNSDDKTHAVALKVPNELGIYDMSGNVWEWCQDWYDVNYYSVSPLSNPAGPTSGYDRVFRGGGWSHYARLCRVSFRYGGDPDSYWRCYGLRLAH